MRLHIVPVLGELGRVWLALQDQSSPGLSQQYPPHTCACSTYISLLPKASRERQVLAHFCLQPNFRVEGGLRIAHGSTELGAQGLKYQV